MDNPLFRTSPDLQKNPIRTWGNLFDNMSEASIDHEVQVKLSKLRPRPFLNSGDDVDALIIKIRKSIVLSGVEKRRILQEVIRNGFYFCTTGSRRDMILQCLVHVTESEIVPKALAFLFILQDISYTKPPEQGPFLKALGRCYSSMEDVSRNYIREQLVARQASEGIENRIITIGTEEARLEMLSSKQIEEILALETSVPVQSTIYSIGQRLLRLLLPKKKK